MIRCSNPSAQYKAHESEIFEAVKRVLDSESYILGPEVTNFENSFSEYCGSKFGVGVNSGTDALTLSLKAMDIGAGDEVITVSHTALATVAAIIATGAKPVLIDIETEYYTMDPKLIHDAITERTKAIIPVHLYGCPADMDTIMSIAQEAGIYVIEDCAQAAGATYKGKRVGSIGDTGCFSFYPTKNLGAIGDGGMVITNNTVIAERVRQISQYGWNKQRITTETGVNSRLDEIQAAILNVKLKYLDNDNAKRKAIAQQYNEVLSSVDIILPKERPETNHVYHLYVIACDFRDKLKNKLQKIGVQTGIHYILPGHKHPGYDSKCCIPGSDLPETDNVVNNILSLPIYPEASLELPEIIHSCL